MLIALSSILPVLVALIFGLNFSRLEWKFVLQRIDWLTNVCLYILLIIMGVSVGQLEGIFSKLGEVGFYALQLAFAASFGTAIMLIPLATLTVRNINRAATTPNDLVAEHFMNYIKDPLQLLGLVGIGFALSYWGATPKINYDNIISILLYILIFFIGIKLSQSSLKISKVIFNKQGLLVAGLTVIGTYFGLLILAWVSGRPIASVLVFGSGFGWYTLSGLMLTQLGDPLLGSIAFFTDIFREIFALVLIPTLARSGAAPIAIGVCGATSMDVTLPVIEKHCMTDQVAIAFASGAIITLLVPFLIPATYFISR